MKKIIGIMLALMLVCVALTACGGDNNGNANGDNGDGQDEGVVLSGDFGGVEFRILSAGNAPCNDFDFDEEATATLDALNQYTALAYDAQYALQFQRLSGVSGTTLWQNNQGLFYTAMVGGMAKYREMENDFGILPYPKLTEVQEDHYTTISPYNSQFICVPVVTRDIYCTGAITEALAYYGEKDVTPALYDITLKGQSARDSESSEMLDIIFDNLIYDIGYYYQIGPYNKQLIVYLRERNDAWASMYETYSNAAQSSLNTINKAYDSAVALWK